MLPIFNGFGWSLVVIDDWLYFSGNQGAVIDNSYNLFRMKTDGTELQNLNSGYCFGMFVYQDWLYYSKQTSPDSYEYSVFRSNLDGTEETLVASNSYNAIIFDNMLYYNDTNSNIYKTNPDGTGAVIIVSGDAINFVIGNGKLIYYDSASNIYVSDIDGANQTMIRAAGSYPILKINSFKDTIFFTTYDENFLSDYYGYNYWLSSISFDGSSETEIYNSISYGTYINMIDDKVYVMDYAMDQVTGNMPAIARRMSFSGTNIEDLSR